MDDIDYDAHGRRTRIEYGNTTATEYFYDELTFRLTRIRTTRSTDSKTLQDLKYTYDPVGNILEVHDDAHEDVFYNDAQVEATGQYEYDPIYRLIKATGREHSGGVGDAQRDQNDLPLWNLPHPNNAAALRRYVEEYTYDKVGNILEFAHEGLGGPSGATWTRTYRYDTGVTSGYANNRLHSTSEPGSAWANYTHDANGNMVAMPHLGAIDYTHRDQMQHADLGGGGDAYYTYDGSGERVRKFIQRTGTTTEERIYLAGWELYRKRVGTGQDIEVERETLHVMDDTRRIAMVETLTVDDEDPVSVVVSRVRYQYGNHLDSAMLECDDSGDVISYEEYHPYGTAAYRSAKGGVEVSERRYRYTGKERDEETGFSYHQWPYYAPWLARWTSADPEPRPEQGELFDYADDDPAGAIDLDGAQPKAPTSIKTPGKGPTRSKPQSSSGLKLDMFTAKVGEFEAKDLNEAATTVFGEISTNINKDTSREAKAVASTIFNRLRRIQEADAEKERTLADLKSATAARKAEEVKLERLKNNRRAEIKEFGSKEYKQRYAAQEAAVQKAMKTLGKAQIAANAASSTASQYRSSLRGGEKKKKPTLRDVVSPHSEYAGHKKGRDDVNAFGRMSKGDQKRNLERWRIAREAVRTLAANPDVADKYTGFKSKAYAKKHGIKGTLIGGNVFDGNWKRKR